MTFEAFELFGPNRNRLTLERLSRFPFLIEIYIVYPPLTAGFVHDHVLPTKRIIVFVIL